MSLVGTVSNFKKVATATGVQRDLVGDSGWVDHISVTFTTTEVGPVECYFHGVQGYESGAVNALGRFELDSTTTSTECQIFVQGWTSNKSFGSQNAYGFFEDVSVGSHTIIFQARNPQSGTTGKLNYFNPGSYAADRIQVIYRG